MQNTVFKEAREPQENDLFMKLIDEKELI